MKSNIDLESRLDRTQARKVLSKILAGDPSCFSYGQHFRERMAERNMIMGDVLNVLHQGRIERDAEFENGQWRFQVSTYKMTVVISFANPNKIRLITCWRLK